MTDVNDLDVAWLAGLLEGEGCFLFGGGTILIRLAMTDRDVVDRAAAIMGGRMETPRQRRAPDGTLWKMSYTTVVQGNAAVAWMTRLRPMMGERRKAKIDAALAYRASRPGRGKRPQPRKTHCSKGHELTDSNWVFNGRKYGRCRLCLRAWERARRKMRRKTDPAYRNKVNTMKSAAAKRARKRRHR